MKKWMKAGCCLLLCAVLASSLAGCAKLSYVSSGVSQAISEIKSGEWQQVAEEVTTDDEPVIEPFTAGTYGGIAMETIDDLVNYYNECYNKTKAKTAQYINADGETVEWYAFGGSKEITISDILVDGKSNSVINNLVPQLLSSLYHPTLAGLQPCMNEDPTQDNDENGASLLTSRVTADDLLTANAVDNGDGTVTLTMQPKLTEMSHCGLDPQGRMFTSLNDLGAVVDAVSVFSWASGTTDENVRVTYKGGTAKVTIDVASGEIIEATYIMKAYVKIQHANIAVVHDKSATATVDYICIFPATQEFYDSINISPVE
ncbi:MAG: hypothetical protein IJ168_08970 [Eubacterium sp.]|nr:hypothetical protein [Eubacterium sp.]